MPNKDSFTFSDKLRKSKSLPLSKRIPSKVGGDGKAKRTLIQRAQRDLPFIIVAAAALLLLPILSRNGGTDDAATEPSMDFVGSGMSDTSSPGGGLGQEIAPSSGFKNPLDYIITKSGTDTSARSAVDTSGEDMNGYEATTSPYTSEKEERATDTYAPAAKASVNHAIERKATQVNALRNSKTVAASGGTGVSRTLAVGSAAKAASGTSINPGVRPVALQPMASAGKGGRSETGEGLYAEAARSLGALNRGPSKQALFDAQLKNVDGTPLSAVGGSPNLGGGSRVGAGGAPSNSVGYKPYLPWWWDFEKQKAMKKWELWDYNFQKALSDNIIKVGTGLALCLATGDAGGKVSKFFGDPGGSDDYTCPGGNVQDWETHRDLMGKDESGSGENKETRSRGDFQEWVRLCNASNGNKGYEKTSSSKKDPLDVRLRCLGLKYKNTNAYKFAQKTNYSDKYNCAGVSAASGIVKFELTAPAQKASFLFGLVKLNKDASARMGHYVVATNMKKEGAQPQVIYIAKGGTLNGSKLQDRIDQLNDSGKNDFAVTKVVGFTLGKITSAKLAGIKVGGRDTDAMNTGRADSIQAKINDLDSLTAEERMALTTYQDVKQADGSSKKVMVSDYASQRASLEVDLDKAKANSTRVGGVSDAAFESILARIEADIKAGEYKSENYVAEQFDLTVRKACSVSTDFYGTKMTNLHHSLRGSTKGDIICGGEPVSFVKLQDSRDFSVTIQKPGKCVYAVVVEKSPITNDKYIVKRVVNFQGGYSKAFIKDNGDGSKTYTFDSSIGLDESSTVDTAKPELKNGNGWVFWVTDNACAGLSIGEGSELPDPDASNIVNEFAAGGQKTGTCQYRWACDVGGCGTGTGENTGDKYCVKDNVVFPAIKVGENYIRKSDASVNAITAAKELAGQSDAPASLLAWMKTNDNKDETCSECVDGALAALNKAGLACTNICAKLQDKLIYEAKADGFAGPTSVGSFDKILPQLGINPEDIGKTDTVKGICPVCTEKEPAQSQPPVNDPCNIVVGDNFDTGVFSAMKNPSSFNENIGIFYSNCLKANSDGSPRTGNVNVWVIGNTDLQGESKVDTCEVNGSTLGAKNVALSEARAITAARGLATGIAKLDYKNGSGGKNMKIVFNFNSVGKAGFTPATKTFIDSFNRSGQVKTPVSLGSVVKGDTIVTYDQEPAEVRTITVNVVGQGSLEMLKAKGGIPKTKAERNDAAYRYIRVTDKNSGSTVALIDQAAYKIDALLTQECHMS